MAQATDTQRYLQTHIPVATTDSQFHNITPYGTSTQGRRKGFKYTSRDTKLFF